MQAKPEDNIKTILILAYGDSGNMSYWLNHTAEFAGDKDVVTTINDSKYVASLNKENKLVEFGGNHLQGFKTLSAGGYGNLYIDEILHFIR